MMAALRGDKILLRKYRPDDVESLYEAVRESIAELSLWLPWCTETYSRKESRDWVSSRAQAWEEEEELSFVIANLDDSRFLGGVGINGINKLNRFANLGYWVRSSAAGSGIATEAAGLVAPWALRTLGFQRVEILAATGNLPSQRVAEKAGATREGVLRNRILLHDQTWDAVVYSIIPSDLRGVE